MGLLAFAASLGAPLAFAAENEIFSNLSLTIAAGVPATITPAVPLVITAAGQFGAAPRLMQLANSPDFAGAPWQEFGNVLTWELAPGSGAKIVYAKFKDSAGRESPVISASIRLEAPAAPVAQNGGEVLGEFTVNSRAAGSLIKDGATIYLISSGQRRGFASLAELRTYGFSPAQAARAGEADRLLPEGPVMKAQDGTLAVDTSGGGTVYLIGGGGIKRGFASAEVFKTLGFSFAQIAKMDLSGYPTGAVIASAEAAHPDGTVVSGGQTLWWINFGQRHGFASSKIFQTYASVFKQVVKATAADLALPEGAVLKPKTEALASGAYF